MANTRLNSQVAFVNPNLPPHQLKKLMGRQDIVLASMAPDPEWLALARIEICSRCALSLLCYAQRSLRGYWCDHCVGWYLFDLNILVQCTEFQSVDSSKASQEMLRNMRRNSRSQFSFHDATSRIERICCSNRRQNQLEVFGGMIVRHES